MPCLCAALEGIGDLRPELHDLVERQRALLQAVGERLALEQLHHQEVRVALVPDVEERADVRVVERGDRLRLALEALAALVVLREAGGEDLDATLRSRRVSFPRQTSPMPPAPIGAVSSYGPSREPAWGDIVGGV